MTQKTKLDFTPPADLTPETLAWVNHVDESFVLESHHQKLLLIAGEAWDRRAQARAVLAKDGLTVVDKYGTMKPHPCVAIERDSRSQFMHAIRELNLDIAAPEESRPPSGRINFVRRG